MTHLSARSAPPWMGLQGPQPSNGSKMQTAQLFPGRVRLWGRGRWEEEQGKAPLRTPHPPGLQNDKKTWGWSWVWRGGRPNSAHRPPTLAQNGTRPHLQVRFTISVAPPSPLSPRQATITLTCLRATHPLPAHTPLAMLFSSTFPTHISTWLPRAFRPRVWR